jgi:hypothetical protein
MQNNALLLGHRAWLAWREGNLAEAEEYGRASVEGDSSHPHLTPLQWVGRWPLLGVAVAQTQWTEAMHQARCLLDLTQQPPPEPVGPLLEGALRAWEAGEREEAHTLLSQATACAEHLGYL